MANSLNQKQPIRAYNRAMKQMKPSNEKKDKHRPRFRNRRWPSQIVEHQLLLRDLPAFLSYSACSFRALRSSAFAMASQAGHLRRPDVRRKHITPRAQCIGHGSQCPFLKQRAFHACPKGQWWPAHLFFVDFPGSVDSGRLLTVSVDICLA
jgi:hypothetical protein